MRVAVYSRVSSEEQVEKGTIENQLEFARKYCDLHQLEVIEWYKDDGVTGTIPLEGRPEGTRLLEDAKAGRLDLLLIYKLDRLGRSARIILNAVHDLEQHGVKIRSMTEPFDTGDPSGRFLLTILAGVADLERETILERLWLGANRAARAGKWLGGIIPYGYIVNSEGFLEINENTLLGLNMSEADVVRLIFRLVADEKYSTIKASDYLNAIGVPTSYAKDGRKVRKGIRKVNTAGIWRPGRINGIIQNTTYKGIHHYGKHAVRNREIITREVPAIVSEETWEKAQLTLKENHLESMRNSTTNYLLRGLIKCGTCGLTYYGMYYKGSGPTKKKNYYVCGGKTSYRGPLQGKCNSKNIPQDWIEDLVWSACVSFITNPGQALSEVAADMEDNKVQKEALLAEKETTMKAIVDKDSEKESILELFRRKIIDFSDVEKQFQKITQERALLEQSVKDIDLQINFGESSISQFASAEELLADLQEKIKNDPPFEVKREIVKTLVKEIIVHTTHDDDGIKRPKASVTVHYTFSKGITHTGARAAFQVTASRNAAVHPCRYIATSAASPDQCWTGLTLS